MKTSLVIVAKNKKTRVRIDSQRSCGRAFFIEYLPCKFQERKAQT